MGRFLRAEKCVACLRWVPFKIAGRDIQINLKKKYGRGDDRARAFVLEAVKSSSATIALVTSGRIIIIIVCTQNS